MTTKASARRATTTGVLCAMLAVVVMLRYVEVSSAKRIVREDDAFFFEKTFVLNLDRRPDRWNQTLHELKRVGLSEIAERVSAVDGLLLTVGEIRRFNVSARGAKGRKILPGQVGCALSHERVMERAATNNLSSVLILEDDVTFVPDFSRKLQVVLQHLPADWELLFLGGSGCEPVDDSNEDTVVVRAKNCWTTHAYAVNGVDAVRKIFDAQRDRLLPADSLLVELQKEMTSYAARPALIYQRTGPSDIALFNRGHLGLRAPLHSSDATLLVWAATSTSASIAFPKSALAEIALEILSYNNNEDVDDYADSMRRLAEATLGLDSSRRDSEADTAATPFPGVYWKRRNANLVYWTPVPQQDDSNDNDVSFESAEDFYAHRRSRGFVTDDWSKIATVASTTKSLAIPRVPTASPSTTCVSPTAAAAPASQKLEALVTIALLMASSDDSTIDVGGCRDALPLRFLARVATGQGTAARRAVDDVPALIRDNFLRYAPNTCDAGVAVDLEEKTRRVLRAAFVNLSSSTRDRLLRWTLGALATNIPSPSGFVGGVDLRRARYVGWPTILRDLNALCGLSARAAARATRHPTAAADMLLRVQTLSLLAERFLEAAKLARLALRLLAASPSTAQIETLRTRAMRYLILASIASGIESDRDVDDIAFRLLEMAERPTPSTLPLEDRAGLAIEAGLLYHTRGMHAEATRQFRASRDTYSASRLPVIGSWTEVGCFEQLNSDVIPSHATLWTSIAPDNDDVDTRCKAIATDFDDAALFLVRGVFCGVVLHADALSFAFASRRGKSGRCVRVFRTVTAIDRLNAKLGTVEALAATGAVRLWQGRLEVAGELLLNSSRSMQILLNGDDGRSTAGLRRREECHPAFARAYANYVLWKDVATTTTRDATFEALETSLRMLRCAGSAWREAQLHADAAQLRALEGDRAFAEAHIEQSLRMFSTLTSEHHPLRVRAQLLQRAILEIFGKMESVKEEESDTAQVALCVEIDGAERVLEVRKTESVPRAVSAFATAHNLSADDEKALARRVYQRRASFLAAYGGPSAKYEK